jgi:hypothetical protein
MTTFDRAEWKLRARIRVKKALKRGLDRKTVKEKLELDLVSIEGLEKVVDWCYDHGVEVDFTHRANGTFNQNHIEINCSSNPTTQLYYLLHECGHYLVDRCDARRAKGDRVNSFSARTLESKVSVVTEEIEAWQRGKNLSARLGVFICEDRFERLKAEALKTYFEWVVKH